MQRLSEVLKENLRLPKSGDGSGELTKSPTRRDTAPPQPQRDRAGNHIPTLEADKRYACDLCLDMGWVSLAVPVGHELFGKAILCPKCRGGETVRQARQQQRERVLSLLREAGLTTTHIHEHLTWDDFSAETLGYNVSGKETAVALAKLWAHGEDVTYEALGPDHQLAGQYPTMFRFNGTSSLWLYGPPGTGKTGLAWVAFRDRTADGTVGVFVEWSDLYEAVRSQYGKRGEDNQSYPLIRAVASTPVLVLDDVGQMRYGWRASDDQYDKLWQVINHRYTQRLPTIITSNLNRAEMRERFDGKISGRLAEMCVMVEMGGPQFREVDLEDHVWRG